MEQRHALAPPARRVCMALAQQMAQGRRGPSRPRSGGQALPLAARRVARRDSEVPGWRGRRSGSATVALLLPWAVIGFSGPRPGFDLLRVAEDVYATHSFSTATMFSALGAGGSVATAATLGLGACGAPTALIVGRSGRDELALFIALLAAVLGSPIVSYLLLRTASDSTAIARPRFSALWLLPMALWVTRMFPAAAIGGE